jgi:hypothetical protein
VVYLSNIVTRTTSNAPSPSTTVFTHCNKLIHKLVSYSSSTHTSPPVRSPNLYFISSHIFPYQSTQPTYTCPITSPSLNSLASYGILLFSPSRLLTLPRSPPLPLKSNHTPPIPLLLKPQPSLLLTLPHPLLLSPRINQYLRLFLQNRFLAP